MNKRLLINFFRGFLFVTASLSVMLFQSCSSDDGDEGKSGPDPSTIEYSDIRDITDNDIAVMEGQMRNAGIEISEETEDEGNNTRLLYNVAIKAVKVSTITNHPDGSGKKIKISGVMLVPKSKSRTLRIVVAPVPTYTANFRAPSNLFKEISLIRDDRLNYLYFWTLQARQGFAILFPDYPGFGDSYQECFPPYIESKPMVSSTIDLTKSAQHVLTEEGYKYKPELIITGYSQGGFVSSSLAKELDTNSSHGLKVSLLVAGGTPANLKMIADYSLKSVELVSPYLLPYALWGYKKNGYPHLNPNHALKEPYATESIDYFNGKLDDLSSYFPKKTADLFTDNFINNLDTDAELAYINDMLIENSVQPWKNKCKIVMVHGRLDKTVHYDNAKDFAEKQNKMGGKVTFYPVFGNHVSSAINYYAYASTYLLVYR